jgi:hypothetical protein
MISDIVLFGNFLVSVPSQITVTQKGLYVSMRRYLSTIVSVKYILRRQYWELPSLVLFLPHLVATFYCGSYEKICHVPPPTTTRQPHPHTLLYSHICVLTHSRACKRASWTWKLWWERENPLMAVPNPFKTATNHKEFRASFQVVCL